MGLEKLLHHFDLNPRGRYSSDKDFSDKQDSSTADSLNYRTTDRGDNSDRTNSYHNT